MHTNIKLGSGTLYVSDGEHFKEVESITGGVISSEELEVAADALSQQFQNVQTTLTLRPTYKKWFKKKKGKRYVYHYIVKEGFDPKIIKILRGEE